MKKQTTSASHTRSVGVSNVISGRKNRSFDHSGGPGNDARGARAAAPEL